MLWIDNQRNLIKCLLELNLKLVDLSSDMHPQGVASGFIWKKNNKHILISAGHCFKDINGIAIETSIVDNGEVLALGLPPVNFLKKGFIGSIELQDLDIAYAHIDLEELYKPDPENNRIKGKDIPLHIYQGPLNKEPSQSSTYTFASYSKVELDKNLNTLFREPIHEIGMKFKGLNDAGELYVFELLKNHKGDAHYEGSSGSPIADESGQICSIVVSGNEGKNEIYGFPLPLYANEIQIPTD